MNEVYRRKPSPPDWPMPANIVQRQVDFTTNELATPYCPAGVVVSEFFIPGTDPMYPCSVHTQFNLYPDTLGVYSPRPGDTTYRGAYPTPRRNDSVRAVPRNLDSLVYTLPGRDTTRRSIFPRDSISGRGFKRDTVGRIDTLPRRPRPDTGRAKPDTIRPRVDTIRPRVDTVKHRQ
jgi:penicillin-binding protein 1A